MTEVHYEVHNADMDIVLDGEVQSDSAIVCVVSDILEEFLLGNSYKGTVYIKMWKVKE